MKFIETDNAPAAIGPYSQAVVCGEVVYCSGQIAMDAASGNVVGGGVYEQTQQIMANLKAVLAEAGSGLDRVVKMTVFLADMNDFAAMNKAYAEALGDHMPARAAVEVSRLPRDVLVEIDAIAALS